MNKNKQKFLSGLLALGFVVLGSVASFVQPASAREVVVYNGYPAPVYRRHRHCRPHHVVVVRERY